LAQLESKDIEKPDETTGIPEEPDCELDIKVSEVRTGTAVADSSTELKPQSWVQGPESPHRQPEEWSMDQGVARNPPKLSTAAPVLSEIPGPLVCTQAEEPPPGQAFVRGG